MSLREKALQSLDKTKPVAKKSLREKAANNLSQEMTLRSFGISDTGGINPVGLTGVGSSQYDYRIPEAEINNLDSIRANNQSGLAQATNATLRGLSSGLMTAVEDMSYILDFENNAKRLFGMEEVQSNWLADIMKDGKDYLHEQLPVYRKNPGKIFDWSDPGFYWDSWAGVLDSAVGFGLVGMGAGAAVKGLGGLLKLGTRANKVGRMKAFGDIMATSLQEGRLGNVSAALITNYGEGKLMALETYEEIYNARLQDQVREYKKLNDGAEPDQATLEEFAKTSSKLAGDGANAFQLNNVAFAFTDYLQLGSIFRGASRASRNMLSKPGIWKFWKTQLATAPKEYFEEVGQNVLQMEAKYQSEQQAKLFNINTEDPITTSTSLFDRVIEFATSEQAQLEGLMGLFGGPVQYAVTTAPFQNKEMQMAAYKKQRDQIQTNKKFIENRTMLIANKAKAIEEAVKSGKGDLVEILNAQSFDELAVQNFARGTTENLEAELQEALKSDEYNEEEKQVIQNKIERLAELETRFNEYQTYANSEGLLQNRLQNDSFKESLKTLAQQKEQSTNELKERFEPILARWNENNPDQQITFDQLVAEIEKSQVENVEGGYNITTDLKGLPGKFRSGWLNLIRNSEEAKSIAVDRAQRNKFYDKIETNEREFSEMKDYKYQLGYNRLKDAVLNPNMDLESKIALLTKLEKDVKGLKNTTLNRQIATNKAQLEEQLRTIQTQEETETNTTPQEEQQNAKVANAKSRKAPLTEDVPADVDAEFQELLGLEEEIPTQEIDPETAQIVEEFKQGLLIKAIFENQDPEEIRKITKMTQEETLARMQGLEQEEIQEALEIAKDPEAYRDALPDDQTEPRKLTKEVLQELKEDLPQEDVADDLQAAQDTTNEKVEQLAKDFLSGKGISKADKELVQATPGMAEAVNNKVTELRKNLADQNKAIEAAEEIAKGVNKNNDEDYPEVQDKYNSQTTTQNQKQSKDSGDKELKVEGQQGVKLVTKGASTTLEYRQWLTNGVDPTGTTVTFSVVESYNRPENIRAKQLIEEGKTRQLSNEEIAEAAQGLPIRVTVDGIVDKDGNPTASTILYTPTEKKQGDAYLAEMELRTQIVKSLIAGITPTTEIMGQYGGDLIVTDTDVSIANIPDFKGKDVTNIPIYYVDSEGKVRDAKTKELVSDFTATTVTVNIGNGQTKPMAGALFTTVKKANGANFPLKLNVAPLGTNDKTVIYELFKDLITEKPKAGINVLDTVISARIAELLHKDDLEFLTKNDKLPAYKEVLRYMVYKSVAETDETGNVTSGNPVTQLYFEKGKVHFGNQIMTTANIAQRMTDFFDFLDTYKSRNIDLARMSKDNAYKEHVINSGYLTTNTDTSGTETLFETADGNANQGIDRYRTGAPYLSKDLTSAKPTTTAGVIVTEQSETDKRLGRPDNKGKVTATTQSVETKKAEIERRRQEEKDRAMEVEGKGLVKPTETTDKGVEKIDKRGTVYNEGDKVNAEFVPTPDGYKKGNVDVIVKQRKPQINTDGVMTQSAEVVVMGFSSLEEGQRYIAENPVRVNPKRIENINAKYDAELKELESQTKPLEVTPQNTNLHQNNVMQEAKNRMENKVNEKVTPSTSINVKTDINVGALNKAVKKMNDKLNRQAKKSADESKGTNCK
jgi:hypothetical protein